MANSTYTVYIATATLMAGLCSFADVADVTITDAGTRQFAPGDAYGALVNAASSGEVRLTSSGSAVEADAISFTNFDATASGAATTFYGGWWDFGDLPATNFMTVASTLSNRSVLLDNGAVVTNVGWAYVAGTSGADNSLTVDGGSSFFAESLRLGCSDQSGQKSKVTVSGGSLLNVSGDLSLSEGSAWRTKNKPQTGNELAVTGSGSRLVVGGQLSLGRSLSSTAGSIGGSTFRVDNGAAASLAGVVVSAQAYHGERNRIVFGKNARVNMTSFSFGTGGTGSVGLEYCAGSNVCEIIDGAVVTNTGDLVFGANQLSQIGNRIIVSNATFHTGIYLENKVNYFLRGQESELVLSGRDAKFSVSTTGTKALFMGARSKFIVENGAEFQLPVSAFSAIECVSETMLFRTGASVSCTSLGTGSNADKSGISNRVVVASGAAFTVEETMKIIGEYSGLEVDDGTLSIGYGLRFGENSKSGSDYRVFSNQTFRIVGAHPIVRMSRNLILAANTRLVVALPSAGYDADVATADNPILRFGTSSGEQGLRLSEGASLAFENAKAFAESHEKKRDYVLFESNHLDALTDEKLAEASSGFPKSLSLSVVQSGSKQRLILHVKPEKGFVLSIW